MPITEVLLPKTKRKQHELARVWRNLFSATPGKGVQPPPNVKMKLLQYPTTPFQEIAKDTENSDSKTCLHTQQV